jgi:exopolyphosphatase/guanosine-5'-triphosphate,3'-diphosphate pyrophosphatase
VKALAAILRIADALDREHRDKIGDITTRIEGDALVLELDGSEDRTLEEWTVLAKSGMIREAFGLDVRIEGATPRSGRTAGPSTLSPRG